MTTALPDILVIGSVNLDIVATGPTLPTPGETVSDATLASYPGGKGANQALAAKRLGANVHLIANVGKDDHAAKALELLKQHQVNLDFLQEDENASTGVALIAVSADGENQIIVAPGANALCTAPKIIENLENVPCPEAIICQLEIPIPAISYAASWAREQAGEKKCFFCLNAAPARPLPDSLFSQLDLLIVNESEAHFYGEQLHRCGGYVAITYGEKGASLFKAGEKIAMATPPRVDVVDTTGAGDSFTAALTFALLQNMQPEHALKFACAAGALAATRQGAQPSFPEKSQIEALL